MKKIILFLMCTLVRGSLAFQAAPLEETFRESLFDVIQTAMAHTEVEALIQTSLESIVLETVTKQVEQIVSTAIMSAIERKVAGMVATRLNHNEVQALVLATFETQFQDVHVKAQVKPWTEIMTARYGQSKVKAVVLDAIQTTLDLTRTRETPTPEEGLWLDDDCPP